MVDHKDNTDPTPDTGLDQRLRRLVSAGRDTRIAKFPPLMGNVTVTGNYIYRVWTVRHGLDWRQQSTGPRGWALVSVDGWHANPCRNVWNEQRGGWDTLPGQQVQLAVFRQHPDHSERHPDLDGTRYATWEDAYEVAWAAELIGLMIYDHSAIEAGLLPASAADEHPTYQPPDETDQALIKAAFQGQIGWDRREGFLFALGPRAGQQATDDERNRLARLVDVGLLTYRSHQGYSGVESTQAGWKYTWH